MPYTWSCASANSRHRCRTTQRAQIALACSICCTEGPLDETGKNRSGSADRQAPIARQLPALPVAVVLTRLLGWCYFCAFTAASQSAGGRPASSAALPAAMPLPAAHPFTPGRRAIPGGSPRRPVRRRERAAGPCEQHHIRPCLSVTSRAHRIRSCFQGRKAERETTVTKEILRQQAPETGRTS